MIGQCFKSMLICGGFVHYLSESGISFSPIGQYPAVCAVRQGYCLIRWLNMTPGIPGQLLLKVQQPLSGYKTRLIKEYTSSAKSPDSV